MILTMQILIKNILMIPMKKFQMKKIKCVNLFLDQHLLISVDPEMPKMWGDLF